MTEPEPIPDETDDERAAANAAQQDAEDERIARERAESAPEPH